MGETATRVVTRRWRERPDGTRSLVRAERTCSLCGRPVGFFRDSCHWCGARLDGRTVRDVLGVA